MLKQDFEKAGLGDIYNRFEEEAFRNIYLKHESFRDAFNRRLLTKMKPLETSSSIADLLFHAEATADWRIEYECYWDQVQAETLRIMTDFAEKNNLFN